MKATEVVIGPLTSATTAYADCSGMVLNSVSLVFTGTATAKIQTSIGANTWVDLTGFGATSSNTFGTFDYALGPMRLVVSSYTSGEVQATFRGLRG